MLDQPNPKPEPKDAKKPGKDVTFDDWAAI